LLVLLDCSGNLLEQERYANFDLLFQELRESIEVVQKLSALACVELFRAVRVLLWQLSLLDEGLRSEVVSGLLQRLENFSFDHFGGEGTDLVLNLLREVAAVEAEPEPDVVHVRHEVAYDLVLVRQLGREGSH